MREAIRVRKLGIRPVALKHDTMRKKRLTADQMYPLIRQYLEGRLKAAAFCAEHGISTAQLWYWLRKYRTVEVPPHSGAFQELCMPGADSGTFVEVTYPDGLRLRLFAPVPAAYLTTLLVRNGMTS